MRKRRERRSLKRDIRLNPEELKIIERGLFVRGLMTGVFMPLAQFIRGAAVTRAYTSIRQFNRRPKDERAELEVELEAEAED